jgi:hypothetical protein
MNRYTEHGDISIIPGLGKLRQEFEVSLGYSARQTLKKQKQQKR